MRSLTVWVTPFTPVGSLAEAIDTTKALASSAGNGWAPSLLLPTHFGQWPQAECRQSLPPDMLVGAPDDVVPIRSAVEAAGVGFGSWGVPVDLASPELAAEFARRSGYYANNIEPGVFWTPGDDPAAVDAWWQAYWDTLGNDAEMLSGNTVATVIPNTWGLDAFANSLPNIAAGCGALAAEVYGGINTSASYPSPNLWPTPAFARLRATGVDANLIPILARDNLSSQISQANRLGHGNVHVWAC